MCFSAGASFGAGIVLTAIGVASIKKVNAPKQYLFASIPLIFAIQQITEGVVWFSLTRPEYAGWQSASSNLFLFFAQVIWPSCVPISMLLLEENNKRKKIILQFLTAIGVFVSSYLGYCLIKFGNHSQILGRHIYYQLDYPADLRQFGSILYISATIAPPLFSSIKKMWLVGVAILISFLITRIFLEEFVISVWCFFAAIISGVVYLIIQDIKPNSKETISVKSL